MHGLLLSLWLGATPPSASPESIVLGQERTEAPGEVPIEGPSEAPVVEEERSPEPPPPQPRLRKGKRLVLASGVAYGVGAAIQWATAGGTGMLGDARPGGTAGVTIGMTLGGIGMLEGVIIGGIGARQLARGSHGHDHRAKPLIAGGAVVTSIGAGAMLGSAIFWPTIRARCPIGAGCSLAGLHLGGAALGVGVGMMSYGNVLLRRDPDYERLSRRARKPLIGGGVAFGISYVLSASLGLASWQDDPDDAVARRTRNRMLIPVVGPWIHAAGPDAPVFTALVTGGLGAVQIGGAIAMAVGAGLAVSDRRSHRRERERVHVTVVPSFDGVSIVGRF